MDWKKETNELVKDNLEAVVFVYRVGEQEMKCTALHTTVDGKRKLFMQQKQFEFPIEWKAFLDDAQFVQSSREAIAIGDQTKFDSFAKAKLTGATHA